MEQILVTNRPPTLGNRCNGDSVYPKLEPDFTWAPLFSQAKILLTIHDVAITTPYMSYRRYDVGLMLQELFYGKYRTITAIY